MDHKTILYIEDNYHNRRLVRKILQLHGLMVAEAEDGAAGLALAKSVRPRVVLLDIGLPGMDGLEIAARLKADPDLQGVVIIALTASAMRGDKERFIHSGCDDYISKPFQVNELVEKVQYHLQMGVHR